VEDVGATAEEHAAMKNTPRHLVKCPKWRSPEDPNVPCECHIILQEKYPPQDDEITDAYRQTYDPDWGGE
jgi:hypothetical protein